jgi:hypothetical protein
MVIWRTMFVTLCSTNNASHAFLKKLLFSRGLDLFIFNRTQVLQISDYHPDTHIYSRQTHTHCKGQISHHSSQGLPRAPEILH